MKMKEINELKRDVFFRLLDVVGRVFIVVEYGDDVQIGQRGFLEQEKEQGIVLVLNSKMNFTWDEFGIEVALVFGTRAEKCVIPIDRVIMVYSPEAGVQFVVRQAESDASQEDSKNKKKIKKIEKTDDEPDKVIRVDFSKGK